MKKITLVLCACAMAFAGLLVSCSNDAGSGDVNLIYRDTTTYDYVYQLSGTKEVKTLSTPSGDKRVLLTTNTFTTTFDGLATLSWTEDDDTFEDFKNYKLKILGKDNFKTVEDETYSGTNASSQGTFAKETTINLTSEYKKVPNEVDFYGFADAFYFGVADDVNTAFIAKSDDIEFNSDTLDDAFFTEFNKSSTTELPVTVSVTGDIAEEDDITIVVTIADDDYGEDGDDDDANTVDAQTITWTFKLTKAAPSEE